MAPQTLSRSKAKGEIASGAEILNQLAPVQIESRGASNSLENSIAGISEIQAPAMMLQEIGGGWDSQLDIDSSMVALDPAEIKQLQKNFVEQY